MDITDPQNRSYQQQVADLDREFGLTDQLQDYNALMGPNSNTWARQLLANAGFSLPYYTVRVIPWLRILRQASMYLHGMIRSRGGNQTTATSTMMRMAT